MRQLTKSIFISLTFVAMLNVGCSIYDGNLLFAEKITRSNNSPSESFKKYWDLSANGKFQELTDLVTHPPTLFWECYFDTPYDCEQKKIKLKEEINNQNPDNITFLSKKDLEDDQDFRFLIIKDQIPKNIYEGSWKSYVVKNEWIYNEEARIRVSIKNGDIFLERDILLFKTDENWRIFRIMEVNDREAFAPPKEN